MEKTKFIILILAIALGIAIGYILFDKYNELRGREIFGAYREGYNQGVTDTITSLIQQTQDCSSVNINLGNFTRKVIDINCLKNE